MGSGETVQAGMLTSLLNALLGARVDIDTVCGGRAQCGRCLIRVRSGAEKLSPIREGERIRLQALGAAADMRLACQAYSRGDVEIEIVNRKHPYKKA